MGNKKMCLWRLAVGNRKRIILTIAVMIISAWLVSACKNGSSVSESVTLASSQVVTSTTESDENSSLVNIETTVPTLPTETQTATPTPILITATVFLLPSSTPSPTMFDVITGTVQYLQLSYELVQSYDKTCYVLVTENGSSHIYAHTGEKFWLNFEFEEDYEVYLTNDNRCQSVLDEVKPNTIGVVCEEDGERTLVFVVENNANGNIQIIKIDLVISSFESDGSVLLPDNLSVDEYELENRPNDEPFRFRPVTGTTEEILEKHASERLKRTIMIPSVRQSIELGNGNSLTAEIVRPHIPVTSNIDSVVKVTQNGSRIFTTWVEEPNYVYGPLVGLWQHGSHWFLEIVSQGWRGEIFRDSQSLNDLKGHSQSFGFQFMHGKPFYFFERLGKIGISYNGEEILLGYDDIPHNHCCSASSLNPNQYENMVSFFALRDDKWYYVEIGVFK
jgi:hypothetical protein